MATLKQSTAYTRMFLMVDSADHVTGKIGLTVTVTLSKAGAAFGAAGATITEVSSGYYKAVLTTTDTNTLGDLAFHCTSTGADPTDFVDQVSARLIDDAAYPATSGRSMVVDAAGLVDANAVKIGPSGTGTAQTARDIGASVLLSTGTGTGQLDFTSGVVKANATQWLGATIPAVNVTGVPLVDLKYTLGTISPATAGSVRADAVTGAVGSVTGLTASNLDATISSRMATYVQPTGFLAATFPSGTVANTTNITAGTITTVTNLTNAPTSGDLTATMKTSVQTASDAAVTANTLVNAIAGYIDTEVAAIKAKTDNLPASPAAVGSAMTLTSAYDAAKTAASATDILRTALTEGYAVDGAAFTLEQALYMFWALMAEKNVSSTTLTTKKLDGSTTAMSFTLDSATSPTSITRSA